MDELCRLLAQTGIIERVKIEGLQELCDHLRIRKTGKKRDLVLRLYAHFNDPLDIAQAEEVEGDIDELDELCRLLAQTGFIEQVKIAGLQELCDHLRIEKTGKKLELVLRLYAHFNVPLDIAQAEEVEGDIDEWDAPAAAHPQRIVFDTVGTTAATFPEPTVHDADEPRATAATTPEPTVFVARPSKMEQVRTTFHKVKRLIEDEGDARKKQCVELEKEMTSSFTYMVRASNLVKLDQALAATLAAQEKELDGLKNKIQDYEAVDQLVNTELLPLLKECEKALEPRCCMICREAFGDDHPEVAIIPCGHTWCEGCVNEWNRDKRADDPACPLRCPGTLCQYVKLFRCDA